MPPYDLSTIKNTSEANSGVTDSSSKFQNDLNSAAMQSSYKLSETSEKFLPDYLDLNDNGNCGSKELQEQIQQLSSPDRETFNEMNDLIMEGNFVEFGKRFQDLQRSSSEPTEKLAQQKRLEAISPILQNSFQELGFSFKFDSEGKSLSLTRFDTKGSRQGTELLISIQMNSDVNGKANYSIQFRNGLDWATRAQSTFYNIDGDGKVTKQLLKEDESGLLVPTKQGVYEISSQEKISALVKGEFVSISEQNERDAIQCQIETKKTEQAIKEQKQRDAELQRQLDEAQRDYERMIEKQNRQERRQRPSETNDDSFDVGDDENEDDFITIPTAHAAPEKPPR